jgi:LysM repeat protein
MRASIRLSWVIALVMAVLVVVGFVPSVQAAPEPAPAAVSCGYWYTVRPGDSWSRVSARTGVPVGALQAANPGLVRPPRNWLYVGDTMWIPCNPAPPPPAPPPSCGYWYRVQPGDSWSVIAARTGTSVSQLQAANPSKVRPGNVIYAGESLWIPCGGSVPPPSPPPHPGCAYSYTVQRGDSWFAISASTGVPVHVLQAANPSKVRPPSYVLYVGETLCIPDP